MPKSAKQLDAEISAALTTTHARRPRRHHATRVADDGWLVARDAILELDPDRASDIVNEIRSAPDHPKPSRAFKQALHDAPSNVRQRFEQRVPEWKSTVGKAEFEEKKPGVMTLYVPGHGYFSAPVGVYHRYKQKTRKAFLKKVLQIYEGIGTGNKGDKAAHWTGYDKDYLAMIVADAFGDEE